MSVDHPARLSALEVARRRFLDDLCDAGLLVRMGVDGLYGRGMDFEEIVEGIARVIGKRGDAVHGADPKVLRFPPVYPREAFERTDFVASFPHLVGAVSTFTGTGDDHRALLDDRDAGREWEGHLGPAGMMLVSAACHPSYATLPKVLPRAGQLLDVYGYCFRREAAMDPARMQAFRMREFVIAGNPRQARDHRDAWVEHGLDVLAELGLAGESAPANDPFFGRAGRLLARTQRSEKLKTELLVRLYGDLDDGTALVSANCHLDHFGRTFGFRTADGEVGHSACVGFGMERIALAMIRAHGLDRRSWSGPLRSRLGW